MGLGRGRSEHAALVTGPITEGKGGQLAAAVFCLCLGGGVYVVARVLGERARSRSFAADQQRSIHQRWKPAQDRGRAGYVRIREDLGIDLPDRALLQRRLE